MRKKSFSIIGVFLLGFVVFFSGCSAPYTPAPQILPAHIKSIAIRPFANNTSQYGLEEKLMLKVVDEFVTDGRLIISNDENEADGILAGEINRYILQPLDYDENLVTKQYKLWILLSVHFVDKKQNVTLWTEPNMEGIEIFYDVTQTGGQTEEEIREIIWENVSRDILKRTFEGFGSVTGASQKKVPK